MCLFFSCSSGDILLNSTVLRLHISIRLYDDNKIAHPDDNFIFTIFFQCFLQLSTAGGRLIISSDGVWDSLAAEVALDCCRGMPPDAAAEQIVKVR